MREKKFSAPPHLPAPPVRVCLEECVRGGAVRVTMTTAAKMENRQRGLRPPSTSFRTDIFTLVFLGVVLLCQSRKDKTVAEDECLACATWCFLPLGLNCRFRKHAFILIFITGVLLVFFSLQIQVNTHITFPILSQIYLKKPNDQYCIKKFLVGGGLPASLPQPVYTYQDRSCALQRLTENIVSSRHTLPFVGFTCTEIPRTSVKFSFPECNHRTLKSMYTNALPEQYRQ